MAREYDRYELTLLESAVSLVQRKARVDETEQSWSRTDPDHDIVKITVEGYRTSTGEMSREEALEQLMEWCAEQLQRTRATKAG